jgi:hypothetical protein
MPDLSFRALGAEPERIAAVPLLRFRLQVAERVAEGRAPTPIHAVALNCQLRIEPARRRYGPGEQERLRDLFGEPERWGQTARPLLWTHASVVVPPFTGDAEFDLPVPCSYDFTLAATRYFDALEGGEVPLCFLFSGTIFYEGADAQLQVAPVPWDREAYVRLPAATWRALMERYYPDGVWLPVRKELFDRLNDSRHRRGLPTWEQALEALLAAERAEAAP